VLEGKRNNQTITTTITWLLSCRRPKLRLKIIVRPGRNQNITKTYCFR